VRGALVTGLISTLPEQKLTGLAADIDAGRVKTLLVVGEDLTAAGLTEAQLAKVQIVYLGTQRDETSAKAAVVLAGLTVFEKAGSFINQQFRLQKFVRAVPGPDSATDDLVILGALLANLTGRPAVSAVDSVWNVMAGEIALLKGLSFAAIPALGVKLDGAAFASLPFVEGKSLEYDPAPASAPAAALT
jgi:NADH-quinone oxidoreductase subunit G